MKKKNKLKIFVLTGVSIILVAIGGLFVINQKDEDNLIGENYIAVFHGKKDTITYETYIYKIKNNHDNYGFEYINRTCNKDNKCEVTKKGKFDFTDGAFSVAKSNKAYDYVTKPNDKKQYTIEEFQGMFIMN